MRGVWGKFGFASSLWATRRKEKLRGVRTELDNDLTLRAGVTCGQVLSAAAASHGRCTCSNGLAVDAHTPADMTRGKHGIGSLFILPLNECLRWQQSHLNGI